MEPRHWNWNWNWNWYHGPFYVQFHKAYGRQTWQVGDLGWGDTIHKVTWHFNIVITGEIKKRYISTFARLMDPKLSRVVTQDEGTHPQNQQLRSHVTKQKLFISTFTRPMAPKTWKGAESGKGGPTLKVKWHFNCVVTWKKKTSYLLNHTAVEM